jgi:hypothetical protein
MGKNIGRGELSLDGVRKGSPHVSGDGVGALFMIITLEAAWGFSNITKFGKFDTTWYSVVILSLSSTVLATNWRIEFSVR